MNKVSIINFNLHRKYIFQDQSALVPQPNSKSTGKRRSSSPQYILKKLIKKGLVDYINPFIKLNSLNKNQFDKLNHSQIQMRHTQFPSKGLKLFVQNKSDPSSQFMTCSRGCGKGGLPKYRAATQEKQNAHSIKINSYTKSGKNDLQDIVPERSQLFKEFRNISEQSLSRITIQNSRRNFKLTHVHKLKYDQTWKKHPIFFGSQKKQTKKLIPPILCLSKFQMSDKFKTNNATGND